MAAHWLTIASGGLIAPPIVMTYVPLRFRINMKRLTMRVANTSLRLRIRMIDTEIQL